MSYYPDPETLAANPPETWRVEKLAERRWGLFVNSTDEHPADKFHTMLAALDQRDNPMSRTRMAVEKERRWYAGETPYGWNSWEACKAEQERNARYQAERAAQRAAAPTEFKKEQWP